MILRNHVTLDENSVVTFHDWKEGTKVQRILRVALDNNSWFDFAITGNQLETLEKCLKSKHFNEKDERIN